MIIIKSNTEIDKIKTACEIWKKVRDVLTDALSPRIDLITLDTIARDTILAHGGKPAFKGYLGFPSNICISRNRIIIHGIPDRTPVLPGDKLTFDVGVEYNGYYCDAAFTRLIPPVDSKMQKLNDVTYDSLIAGINAIAVGKRVGVIGDAIKKCVSACSDYYLLPDFCGHGCGKRIHEDPRILNDSNPNDGPLIREGMVLCIEPMVMTKNNAYTCSGAQWNVQAKLPGSLVCHWEHMVLIDYNKKVVVLTD